MADLEPHLSGMRYMDCYNAEGGESMLMIPVTMLLSVVQVPQSVKNWAPPEILDEGRYSVVSAHPPGDSFAVRRLADQVGIYISFNDSTPKNAKRPIMTAEFIPHKQTLPASGFPLGKQCLVTNRPGCYRIHFVGNYEDGSITLSGPLMKDGRRRSVRKDDLTKDAALAESLLRTSLSSYAGRRVKSAGTIKINYKAVQKYTDQASKLSFVNLKAWLSASGLRCTNSDTSQRIAFNKKGIGYVYMAGSETYKVGKSWKPMDDIVIKVDGSLIVPMNALPK